MFGIYDPRTKNRHKQCEQHYINQKNDLVKGISVNYNKIRQFITKYEAK